MRSKLLVIILICFFQPALGQQKSLISNTSIKDSERIIGYKLVDTNKVELTKFLVDLELADSIKMELKKLCKSDWMALLKNENTDWAANLCLYDFYKREATVARIFIKDRNEWVKYLKAKDFAYWEKNLPH